MLAISLRGGVFIVCQRVEKRCCALPGGESKPTRCGGWNTLADGYYFFFANVSSDQISLTAAWWMFRALGWNQPSRQDVRSGWCGVICFAFTNLLAKAIQPEARRMPVLRGLVSASPPFYDGQLNERWRRCHAWRTI